MKLTTLASALAVAIAVLPASEMALAQTVAPEFADAYTVVNIGTPAGVPANFGGLTIRADDPNTLYLGGAANGPLAMIYMVPLTRDAEGRIVGFGCGSAVAGFSAPGLTGGHDGGLEFGPGGVLFYTTFNDNCLGQIKPGSAGPDRLIQLSTLGVATSTGSLRFVPPGFPGAGRLKIVSYSASLWYDTTVVPQRDGTYSLGPISAGIPIGGGPEGVVYIAAGNPGFATNSVLVSQYAAGRVVAFEVNANGDPIPATERQFVTGLSGAEGATIDPITGDFLFSTFGGGNRVIAVRGFQSASCVGDVNGSGVVDAADLAVLLGQWGQSGGGEPADLNTDCEVNALDLGILLGNWGSCT